MLHVLQPDLRSLSLEGKRRHPDIKEAAERAEMRLRAFEEQHKGSEALGDLYLKDVADSDDILRPFVLSLETKNAKLVTIAVGSLHKLFSRNAVSVHSIPALLRGISNHLDNPDENLLLKILQATVALLTSNIAIHNQNLSGALSICLYLNRNKKPIIRSTSGASLKQVATNLIERTIADKKPLDITDTESYGHDSYHFILDICRLTRKDNPTWLKIKLLSLPCGMEILESLLTAHPTFFISQEPFLMLLKDQIFPLVVQSFNKSQNFPVITRLLRLIKCIVHNFSNTLAAESEVFLCRLVRMVKAESPSWLNALVIEIFSEYFRDEELLVSLYINYERSHGSDADGSNAESKVLQNIMAAIATYTQYLAQESKKLDLATLQSQVRKQRNIRVLEMLNHNEAPSLSLIHMQSLCSEAILNITHTLEILVEKEGLLIPLGRPGDVTDSPPSLERISYFQTICSVTWTSILGVLSSLISVTKIATGLSKLFQGYTSFILVCSVLDLHACRDAFITSLTKKSFPKDQNIELINPRCVEAMRTLLGISCHLGNVLGTGWHSILIHLNSLYTLISSPQLQQLVQQRESIQLTGNGNHSPTTKPLRISMEELGSIRSLFDDLFKKSSALSERAFLDLIKGLFDLHNQKLADFDPMIVPYSKEFALDKLEEVVIENVARAELIWDSLFDHFKGSLRHSNASVRHFGLDSFSRIIISMFSYFSKRLHEETSSLASDSFMDTQIYVQNRLLEALEETSRSKYNDVRQKTLETLNLVLQSSGQSITTGWPLILSILMTIAVNDDKPHIVFGFNSVTLICTDFLSHLQLDCLALFITTIGCYGLQSSEINVSLTGVGLLLSIADFLGKDGAEVSIPEVGDYVHVERTSDDGSSVPMRSPIAKLWISLITEMKQLCLDQRFEVRNCSLITLVKTFTTHGQVLELDTWHQCIWDILFPMLDDIQSATSVAATDEVTVELGTQGGRSVKLLVHHSRNSVQKQWSETVFLSYGGFTRIVRHFGSLLMKLHTFDEIWKKLVVMGEEFTLSHGQEVAGSVLGNLRELSSSVASQNTFLRKHWDLLWFSFEKIANTYKISKPNEKTLTSLSTCMLRLKEDNFEFFSSTDFLCWLRIIEILCVTSQSTNPKILSGVQRDVLKCLAQLHPPVPPLEPITSSVGNHENVVGASLLYLDIFAVFVSVLSYVGGYDGILQEDKEPRPELFFFTDHLVVELSLLSGRVSEKIKAKALKDLVEALGSCLSLKYSHYISSLWKNCLPLFLSLLEESLPFLQSYCSDIECAETWVVVHQFTEQFLFDARRVNFSSLSVEEQSLESKFDLKVLDCIVSSMLLCEAKNFNVHKKLIQLLVRGSRTAPTRETFALRCYSDLFALASCQLEEDTWKMELAQHAAPSLMDRVNALIKQFIVEDNNNLSESCLTETLYVLNKVKEIEMLPSLILVDTQSISDQYTTSSRKLLLYIFPLLCECITAKETSTKSLLKDLFAIVGQETGLRNK